MSFELIDIGTIRGIGTGLVFLSFVCVTLWAYSGRARKGFDEAALLPFSEDDLPAPKGGQTKEGNKNG